MAVIGEMRQLTIGGKTYTLPTYSLPIASSSTLGGIKVGSGLSIDPSTGTLTATGTSITIDTTMSDSSTNAVQNKVIKSYADGLIAALDGGTIGTPGAGKTLTALSQTNGQVSATFSNISITKSQVSDFPTNVSAFTNDAGYTTNTGTVTSVRVQATSPVQSSTSTAQSATLNTTISLTDAYGDTKNPYGSKTKNYVLAAPSNTAGAPTFRALVAADIPDLSSIYLTSYTETDPTVPAWAKASTKPIYTASEVGALPSTTVIPTKVSELTNDSGYITSYTDEKLKWTASTSSNTYYPLQSTSTATTSTANTLNSISFYQYYNTAGGYRRLILGNTTAYTSTGGAYGTIRLYGTGATYYGDLNPGTIGANSLTANRTWTLPNATGTIALTTDIPTVPTNVSAFTNDAGYLTSYTETDPTVPSWAKASSKPSYTASEVGAAASDHAHGNITNGGDITATAPTIANGDQIVINDASASKITNGPTFDGSTTTKYLSQKGTWESLPQGTAYSAGTGLSLDSTTFNHSNSVTAQTTQAVYPIKIDAQGHISAYGTAVTIVNTRGTATSGGTTLSVVNTGDMYTWNNKSDTDEKVKQESLNGTNSGKNFLFTSSLQTTNSVTGTITYGRYITYNDYAQTLTLTYNNDSTKSLSLGYSHLSIKNGTYSIYLYANTPTANRQIYLPDKAGTIALTSDIPDISNKADKATTLSGYGITDAKIVNGTITLGSNTITPLTSFTESDPVFSASAAAGITSSDITNWNNKSSTDTKVTQTPLGANNTVYPLFTTTTQSGTVTDTATYSNNIMYNSSSHEFGVFTQTGVTIIGPGYISIGNSYGVNITPETLTSNRTITLPNKTGTVALTTDIPTNISSFTNDVGYISSSTTSKIWAQTTAPTSGMVAGDIWIDTSVLS